jgi:hypothetical protein
VDIVVHPDWAGSKLFSVTDPRGNVPQPFPQHRRFTCDRRHLPLFCLPRSVLISPLSTFDSSPIHQPVHTHSSPKSTSIRSIDSYKLDPKDPPARHTPPQLPPAHRHVSAPRKIHLGCRTQRGESSNSILGICVISPVCSSPLQVFIAGNFNSWSDSATPLHKLDDGSFAAEVPLPWGEKQAFKYVVDGGKLTDTRRQVQMAECQSGRSERTRRRNGVSWTFGRFRCLALLLDHDTHAQTLLET